MNITRIETIHKDETLQRFSTTRLRGHGQPCIYEHARLEWVPCVDPKSLFPAQRYVLKEDYKRLHFLYEAFQKQQVNIFGLEGGLFFWLAHPEGTVEEGPIPLMPPIVEMSKEPDGRIVPLINDGMHRVYAAMKLEKPINIILAHDVPLEYPYYAYALEKGWDEVVELDELPDNFVKKTYRDPNHYKALFRDFNAVFGGIQKQRKKSNPAHLRG